MKNILFATTALVATAGIASADVTFSGKGEAGFYQTEKTAAVKAVAGKKASSTGAASLTDATAKVNYNATTGALEEVAHTAATDVYAATGPDAAAIAAVRALITAQEAIIVTQTADALADKISGDADKALSSAGGDSDALVHFGDMIDHEDLKTAAQAEILRLEKQIAVMTGTVAVAEGKAGDMVAYSGYQADVTLSAETDSGISFSMGFDLEAGLMADQDDDREMDAKTGNIANSKLTMVANGYTLVIGQDEIDDLYDDSQNGDISLSGDLGGLSFTVVHDLDDSVAKVDASTVYTVVTDAATVAAPTTGVDTLVVTDAVAAVNNGSSIKLGYTTGAATLGFVATSANDRNNAANKITVGYTVSDALSFSFAHNSEGKRDAIMSASATYAMDALTFTVSYADDKNHAGNTNKNGKASTNLKVGYAQGPITATFATDESSQWWVNTKYDLGGGASAFATVDHQEFAVAGLSFAF